MIDCGELENPANGSVSFPGTTLGSQATYSCDVDFELTGNETRECLSNCEWSGTEPVCERKCERELEREREKEYH